MCSQRNLLKVFFRNSCHGQAMTTASATSADASLLRVEDAQLVPLATLAADLLGDPQPSLGDFERRNLAKWVIRFGCRRFGERSFLRETARALIRRPS
mgnify:CR=1 FL=1